MKELLRAKKTTGLDDIFKDYQPQQLEQQKAVENDYVIRSVLVKYQQLLHLEKMERESYDSFTEVLTPAQIESLNSFLYGSYLDHLNHENSISRFFQRQRTGSFLSKLMQNSYVANHNDFHLTIPTTDSHNGDYCLRLQGSQERLLRLTFNGAGAYSCAVSYGDITVEGKVPQMFATNSIKSRFIVGTAFEIGNRVEDCQFKIQKWYLLPPGLPFRRCEFEVWSAIHSSKEKIYTEDCTFTFHQQQDADKSKKRIVSGNRIQYIKPDGSIEIVRDFDDI